MILKNLQLINFRNFAKVKLDFPKTTLLIGNNAQGKSNLLEAIFFLATTKSARVTSDSQLIKQEETTCLVDGGIEGDEKQSIKLGIAMQILSEGEERLEKRTKVNGIPRRACDYIGNLVVVYFSPEDINLVSGPPALRRWHIDLTLAQIDKDYKLALNNYFAALSSRNRILKKIKEGQAKLSELDFWSLQMIRSGGTISSKREEFFRFVNEQEILNSLGEFKIVYQPIIISEDILRQYLSKEIASGISLVGPHRDDFIFKLNNKDLAYFGSRGEQRMAVLELKLSELQFVRNVKKILPVLLLDDIFSELDLEHKEAITKVVSSQQTILSAIETGNIPDSLVQKVQVIKVKKGGIEE